MKKNDDLLKKVEQFERLAVYGDRQSFLKAITAQYAPFSNPNAPTSFEGDLPAAKPAAPKYPPVSKNVQYMLNMLLVPQGDIVPLNVDGQLGPKTQEAMQKFKQRFGQSPTVAAITQKFNENKGQVAQTSQPSGAPVSPMQFEKPLETKQTGKGEAGQPRPVEGP